MSTIDLSLSTNYVKSWTITEAIRELLQNAFDQETKDPENKCTLHYDRDQRIVTIKNRTSVLDRASLLLGESSKRDDPTTIGQFGEGYKLALLILTRESKSIKIFNYSKQELWTPIIEHSENFGTDVLKIDISYSSDLMHSEDSLVFELHDIDYATWSEVCRNTLQLCHYRAIQTDLGEIIVDNELHDGRIYVNGLYVATHKKLQHGYNFKPHILELNRDRKSVDTFNLCWNTSKMWARVDEEHKHHVKDMLYNDRIDVEYLQNNLEIKEQSSLIEEVSQDFYSEHGADARPVTTEAESKSVRNLGYTPVIVPESHKSIIQAHHSYSLTPPTRISLTPHQQMSDFKEHAEGYLPTHLKKVLEALVEQSRNW